MNNEFKPCPFCGCEDIRVALWNTEGGYPEYSVCCSGCHVETTQVLSKEFAIRMWNRRAKND